MDTDTAARFHKRFALEHDLWRSSTAEDGHMIIAASFALRPSGAAEIFDIALMPVTREWLPYESLDERELIRAAVAGQRMFVKGLRVDPDTDRTIASITLTDVVPPAVAVHLAGDDKADGVAHEAFLATAGVDHLAWRPGDHLPKTAPVRPQSDTKAATAAEIVRLPPFFDGRRPPEVSVA